MNGTVQVCRCSRCVAGLRVLTLEAGATEEAIHEAYRDLVKVWHPDRFEADQRLRARAEEQFKLIQVAVRELQEHFQRPGAGSLRLNRNDGQNGHAAWPADGEFSRARELFRNLVDGERYFLHPQLPEYALERVRRCDAAAADSLLGFVDRSLARTGRSFLAFTPDTLLVRESFSTTRMPYADLGQWRIVLSSRAADRVAEKLPGYMGDHGCTLELRNADDRLLEPIAFPRRSQAEVFAAVIRDLQQSGTF